MADRAGRAGSGGRTLAVRRFPTPHEGGAQGGERAEKAWSSETKGAQDPEWKNDNEETIDRSRGPERPQEIAEAGESDGGRSSGAGNIGRSREEDEQSSESSTKREWWNVNTGEPDRQQGKTGGAVTGSKTP